MKNTSGTSTLDADHMYQTVFKFANNSGSSLHHKLFGKINQPTNPLLTPKHSPPPTHCFKAINIIEAGQQPPTYPAAYVLITRIFRRKVMLTATLEISKFALTYKSANYPNS